MSSHVYVPTTPITASADAEEPPCKICGKGPGGEHRELESLVDSQHRHSDTVVPEEDR